MPAEFDRLFRYLKEHVAGIDDITLSVHCHNDLGMAVANTPLFGCPRGSVMIVADIVAPIDIVSEANAPPRARS